MVIPRPGTKAWRVSDTLGVRGDGCPSSQEGFYAVVAPAHMGSWHFRDRRRRKMEGSEGETLSFWDIELNVIALPWGRHWQADPYHSPPKSQRSERLYDSWGPESGWVKQRWGHRQDRMSVKYLIVMSSYTKKVGPKCQPFSHKD